MNNEKIQKFILVIIPIIIIYLTIAIFIFYFLPNGNNHNKNIKHKNSTLKKNNIKTKLDLVNIFQNNIINSDNYEAIPAVFNNKKAYFAYVPHDCDGNILYTKEEVDSYIEECTNGLKQVCSDKNSDAYKEYIKADENICKPDSNYCQKIYSNIYENSEYNDNSDKESICKFLNISKDTDDFDATNVRYILESNIDGTNLKKLKKHDLSDPVISFDHLANNSLFYTDTASGTYKIDFKSDSIKKVSENTVILGSYPFSDNKKIAIGKAKNDKFDFDFYDIKSLKKVDQKRMIISNNIIRIDNNNKEEYYTYDYDNKKIYKNGKIVYDTKKLDDYQISDFFTTKDYFYIVYRKEEYNKLGQNYIAIINKKNYQLVEQIKLNKDSDPNLESILKYIKTNENGDVFLTDSYKIYKFNENAKKIEEIKKLSNNSKKLGINGYHNYIYYSEGGYLNNLVFYNTITGEKKLLSEEIKYLYLNEFENRIYIVERENNRLVLNYYDIN